MRAPDAATRERRRDIQGSRAVAVLLVIIFHAGLPLKGGFIGVDVFFVISGFVIGSALLAELDQTSSIALGHFYARRVRRLLPALAALLLVSCVLASWFASPLGPQQATSQTGTAASLFGANLQLFRSSSGYFDVSAEANPLLHTWSLSVEEQFYFLFPSVMLVMWRVGRTRAIAISVAAIAIASFGVSLTMSYDHVQRAAHALGGSASRFAFYSPITRAWEFAIGVAIALASKRLANLPRVAGHLLGAFGFCTVVIAAFVIDVDTPFPGLAALAPVVGTALIIVAGHDRQSTVSRALAIDPLVWLGDISYGWYLWHWPLIVFANAMWPHTPSVGILAAGASLVPTVISYRWLETPLRRNRRIVGSRAWVLAVVSIGLGLVGAFGLREVTSLEQQTTSVAILANALRGHADELHLCNGGSTSIAPECTWPSPNARGTIVLVGDSNAGHFTEAVASAANSEGYSLRVTTLPACPFVDALTRAPHHDAKWCHDFVVRTLSILVGERPALVIIGTASTTYLTSPEITVRRTSNQAAPDGNGKLDVWRDGVHAVLQTLDAASIPTLWIHSVPRIANLEPMTCPFAIIRRSDDTCSNTISRQRVEAEQGPVRSAEEDAIRRIPSASGVDFSDELCSATTCSARRGDTWIFRDTGHLTIEGAMTLVPQFRALIVQHARHER